MWIYSSTTATSAHASSASSTASGRTYESESGQSADDYNGVSDSYATENISETFGTSSVGPFKATYGQAGFFTAANLGPGTYMTSQQVTHDFTRSETRYTSVNNAGASTTSSSQETTTRSLNSYRSGTAITGTAASAVDTTTTETTTRSIVSSAAGPTTTSAVETVTRTTSTTETQSVNATGYLTAASAALVAPVSLVLVSEAEATEQAWEITATAYTAGFVSELGSTFTKRTATLTTTSRSLPVTDSASFTTTYVGASSASATLTLTTTTTSTVADTYVPFASVYPATATATRAFTVLTTQTTSALAASWVTGGATVHCNPALFSTALNTFLTVTNATMTVTINASPTQTTTASMHVTYLTTSQLARFRSVPEHATSASASASYSDSGLVETVSTTETSTSVSTTTTGENTVTGTETLTETASQFVASQLIVETCAVPGPHEDYDSFSDEVFPGMTNVEYRTTTHDAPNPHTISVETWIWSTYSTTVTTTETETPTTTVSSWDETEIFFDVTTSVESASSMEGENGISYTWPRLHSQVTLEGSVKWTAHQMHPRPGWRHPLELEASGGLASMMTVSPASTIYFPYAATQDDSNGARVPFVQTELKHYTTSDSVWTAQWQTSDSRLHWTSAVTSTYTTTELHGVATATVTRTATDSLTSGSATLNGVSLVSWYAPQSTTAHTNASKMGGMAAKSEYGAAVYFPPGVRHWTHQVGGTLSTSSTEWLVATDLAATSTEGYALPTRTESVWSVTTSETHPAITHMATGGTFDIFFPLGWIDPLGVYGTAGPDGVGLLWRPAVTLSLNPNL